MLRNLTASLTCSLPRLRALVGSPFGTFCTCFLFSLPILILIVSYLPISQDANAMPESQLQGPPGEAPDTRGTQAALVPSHPDAVALTPEESTPEHTTRRLRVGPGDSISSLLDKSGVARGELQTLLHQGEQTSELRRVFPGQWVEISVNDQGGLEALRIERDAANSIEWTRQADQNRFQLHVEQIEPEVRVSHVSENIIKNLFVAGQRGGLGDDIILRLANIFRWDIDFVLDVRVGDSFELLYESEYLEGKFHRNGDILAARFVNLGTPHTAVRYVDEHGEKAYYTPDGKNLRGAFLRAPVDFTRVSSGFSHKRMHPLFNRVRAHLGVDYAAPTGTPVKAAGRGRVKTVNRRASSGNYIEIQHENQIETRYLHLSRFARGIKPGTRVSQGDVIGYVGSTGWSTGPHLHYEFIQDGRHMDPRKVEVVRDSSIVDAELPRFIAQTAPLRAQLDSFDAGISVVGAN